MKSLIDQVGKHRKHIKYEALTYSLAELVNMHLATPREMEIQPEFQRLFRWSREQQSLFIESLILEIPIPPLFFFEQESGVWELLDGLQRISTIIKFIGSTEDVPLSYQGTEANESEWHYENENRLDVPLQLVAGEYLTDISGLSFLRLPAQLQLNLKRSRLHVYVLKRETDPTYKYEVFKRLNSGGANLEDQELRNCSVRLLGQRFPQFLQDQAKYAPFVEALALKTERVQNAYIDELVLRFLALKNYSDHFKHDVAAFLTKYMEEVAAEKIRFNYDDEERLFKDVWDVLAKGPPNGEAFKNRSAEGKPVGTFSPTVFEVVSLAVATNLAAAQAMDGKTLSDSLVTLVRKAGDEGLLGAGTNSKKKTIGRIRLSRDWLKKDTSDLL